MDITKVLQQAVDNLDSPNIRKWLPHVQKDTTTILLMAILVVGCETLAKVRR